MNNISSTMAGNVWKILVEIGDKVEEGKELVILESMKMEIPIEAEISGSIKKVLVNEGDFVNEGEVLIMLEE